MLIRYSGVFDLRPDYNPTIILLEDIPCFEGPNQVVRRALELVEVGEPLSRIENACHIDQ